MMSFPRLRRPLASSLSLLRRPPTSSASSSIPRRTLVDLAVDESSGVGTLTMSSPPVNSITLDFMEAFIERLDVAHKNPACKGLILASSSPTVFSAGLDIQTMFQPKEDKARVFWYTFQRLWMDLYLSKLPVVAAIGGAAPAGGTILACACDYRVFGDHPKLRMGLNETLLGIVAPWWAAKMFVNTVGPREGEIALQLAKLYSPEEALKVGLVDSVVPVQDVLSASEAHLKKFMAIDANARFNTKSLLRNQAVEELLAFDRTKDIDLFFSTISEPHVQKVMGHYLAALKAKSKAK